MAHDRLNCAGELDLGFGLSQNRFLVERAADQRLGDRMNFYKRPGPERPADLSVEESSESQPLSKKTKSNAYKKGEALGVAIVRGFLLKSTGTANTASSSNAATSAETKKIGLGPLAVVLLLLILSFIGWYIIFSSNPADTALSKTEYDQASLRQACEAQLRSQLRFPSSFSLVSMDFGRSNFTGEPMMSISFEALNGFGIRVPQIAHCAKRSDGIEIKISPR